MIKVRSVDITCDYKDCGRRVSARVEELGTLMKQGWGFDACFSTDYAEWMAFCPKHRKEVPYADAQHTDQADQIEVTPVNKREYRDTYYKDQDPKCRLISGLPLPKDADGVVRDCTFINCDFHPNCADVKFERCVFTVCSGVEYMLRDQV